MTRQFRLMAAIIGTLVGTLTLLTAMQPIFRSDTPPWAGISRVETSARSLHDALIESNTMLQTTILEGQIRAIWTNICLQGNLSQHVRAKLILDLASLKARYVALTGKDYPLDSTCT